MRERGLRASIDERHGERMQARVRDAELKRIPYVVVIGKRDVERGDGMVRVRDVRRNMQEDVSTGELIDRLARRGERAASRVRRARPPSGAGPARRHARAAPRRGQAAGCTRQDSVFRSPGGSASTSAPRPAGSPESCWSAGAASVYAVDAGFGQLLGSLRQDPRVVNLEATNVSELDSALIPEAIEAVTIDVSYLALAAAVAQLDRITIAPGRRPHRPREADVRVAPGTAPTDPETVDAATERAVAGIAEPGGRSSASCRRRSSAGEGRSRPWSTPGDHREVTGSLALARACYIPRPTPDRGRRKAGPSGTALTFRACLEGPAPDPWIAEPLSSFLYP